MKKTIFAVLMLVPMALRAAEYSIQDAGDFVPVGLRVEFADRFGWESYKVKFDFGLETSGRALSKDSKLTLKITKRDGKEWQYSCKAKGRRALAANVNFLHGKGISVVAQCRIAQDDFAEVVGLDGEDVGLPTLVFHAVIQDGQISPGAQRGLYFLPGGPIASSVLNEYASSSDDASSLTVLFRSN